MLCILQLHAHGSAAQLVVCMPHLAAHSLLSFTLLSCVASLNCSLLQAVKRREKYVRANDATLLPIDGTVGNLLEWAPVFLGFFWMSERI
jgi:hypothetical protein